MLIIILNKAIDFWSNFCLDETIKDLIVIFLFAFIIISLFCVCVFLAQTLKKLFIFLKNNL